MKLRITKECPMCGNLYEELQKTQVTCGSRECRLAWRRKKRIEKMSVTRTCRTCGKEFTTTAPRKKYCSYKCAKKGSRKPPKGEQTLVCKNCGIEFKAKRSNVRFCSPRCNLLYKGETFEPQIIKCEICGNEFLQKTRKSRCCSKRCRATMFAKQWREKYPDYYKGYANKRHEKVREDARRSKNDVRASELLRYDTYNPLKKDQMRFAESLHVMRLTPNKCRCLDCGTEFIVSKNPDSALEVLKKRKTTPCPKCGIMVGSGVRGPSSAETELAERYPNLTERNIRPDWMDGRELDLYDPERKIAIEFNGIVWHSTKHKKETDAHKVKADLCEKAGVQLIQIWETEWFQKKECVLDKLDAIMHLNMTKVAARKLKARIMETKEERAMVSRFLDENHIQGHAGCQWAVALMDGEDIAAVCTFKYGTGYANAGSGKKADYYWELNRYATRLHTSVQGGISKCISAFRKSHPDVKSIVSFADRRWTCPTRSAYASSGFVEECRVAPNYMYTDLKPYTPLRNKQYMRKSSIESRAKADPEGPEAKVFSWDKTETVMSEELGWYRLYDAGKIRYRMNF